MKTIISKWEATKTKWNSEQKINYEMNEWNTMNWTHWILRGKQKSTFKRNMGTGHIKQSR